MHLHCLHFISLIFGKFSIVQTPSIKRVAGNIATAAFFAPPIETSPFNEVGPVTTNFSNKITPNIYSFLLYNFKIECYLIHSITNKI